MFDFEPISSAWKQRMDMFVLGYARPGLLRRRAKTKTPGVCGWLMIGNARGEVEESYLNWRGWSGRDLANSELAR